MRLKRGRGRAQVLQDRSETGSRHGRATFAVLLFQVTTGPARPGARECHCSGCRRALGGRRAAVSPDSSSAAVHQSGSSGLGRRARRGAPRLHACLCARGGLRAQSPHGRVHSSRCRAPSGLMSRGPAAAPPRLLGSRRSFRLHLLPARAPGQAGAHGAAPTAPAGPHLGPHLPHAQRAEGPTLTLCRRARRTWRSWCC